MPNKNTRTPKASAAIRTLSPIGRRIDGCSGLFTRATFELRDKIAMANDPSKDDGGELLNSSKLGRAVEDLQAVKISVASIIKELQRLTGEAA